MCAPGKLQNASCCGKLFIGQGACYRVPFSLSIENANVAAAAAAAALAAVIPAGRAVVNLIYSNAAAAAAVAATALAAPAAPAGQTGINQMY